MIKIANIDKQQIKSASVNLASETSIRSLKETYIQSGYL
jgi:hypothetical protein